MIELDTNLIQVRKEQEPAAISGNAAVARGIIEAGIQVITSYPGTPCAESIEELVVLSERYKHYVEWSVNEKVAFEIAAGAAMQGIRSAFVTKHVGMNVASDILMHVCYSGVNAGMVIISADDPGAYDSPIEQDTRFYARASEIFGMEPSSQQEAKDMLVKAVRVSEELRLPVFIRITNRVLYGRGKVIMGKMADTVSASVFKKGDLRWFIAGKNAVKQHAWLHEQQPLLDEASEASGFNRIDWSQKRKYGIIASGVAYYYAREAVKETSLREQISILKIGCFNPLPALLIRNFLNEIEEALIVEELEPFIEERTKGIASDVKKRVKIFGKQSGHFPHVGALCQDMIKDTIKGLWMDSKIDLAPADSVDSSSLRERFNEISKILPSSHTTFCAGCPHRAALYVLKKSLSKLGTTFIITGDIGCYLLSIKRPFRMGDTVFCMGASIGIGAGLSVRNNSQRIIALIGDSTFLHAGTPALVNCSYNNTDIFVYILDNRTVAMTGLQPYPGTGMNAQRKETKKIKLEKIVQAAEVDYIKVIDPFNVRRAQGILMKALAMKGQRVVIARHPCAQLIRRESEKKNKRIKTYTVAQERCKKCRLCIKSLGCPAIIIRKKSIYINRLLCSGCGLCVQVCPYHAITASRNNG